jgi:plasmid maintenance system antidote protein VapI
MKEFQAAKFFPRLFIFKPLLFLYLKRNGNFSNKTFRKQLTEKNVDQAQRIALADSRIKQLLNNKGYISIGASLRILKQTSPSVEVPIFTILNIKHNKRMESLRSHPKKSITFISIPRMTESEEVWLLLNSYILHDT